MESKVLIISPEATIKIIQDWYRNTYPTEKYMVMMTRTAGGGTTDDKTYIIKSSIDLYHTLVAKFDLEDRIKTDIDGIEGDFSIPSIVTRVEPSDYFSSWVDEKHPGEYRGGGTYLPYLFFATKGDLDNFIQIGRTEVAKIIDKYQ